MAPIAKTGAILGVLTALVFACCCGGLLLLSLGTPPEDTAQPPPSDSPVSPPSSSLAPSSVTPSSLAPSSLAPSSVAPRPSRAVAPGPPGSAAEPSPASAAPPSPSSQPAQPSPRPLPPARIVPYLPPIAVPDIEVHEIIESVEIPYSEKTLNDPSLASGTREVREPGVTGEMRRTYEAVMVDGKETGRRVVGEKVLREPTPRLVALGTRRSECDPNYSGPCVPIASDVDCEGGTGDGPAYVRGPVTVVGTDKYGLDGNNDGVGCE